jgi:hypothetical protein
MKKLAVIVIGILAFAFLASAQRARANHETSSFSQQAGAGLTAAEQDALKEALVKLEKQSWEAWQKHDGKFFQKFLSDDHVEVGFGGLTNKDEVVRGVTSPMCVVKSYSVDKFELTILDTNTALLNYHAAQDTTCGGKAVPSPVWASSLYIKRGDHWLNVFYQQTQTRN